MTIKHVPEMDIMRKIGYLSVSAVARCDRHFPRFCGVACTISAGRTLCAVDHRAYNQGRQRVPEDRTVSEGDWPNASL